MTEVIQQAKGTRRNGVKLGFWTDPKIKEMFLTAIEKYNEKNPVMQKTQTDIFHEAMDSFIKANI